LIPAASEPRNDDVPVVWPPVPPDVAAAVEPPAASAPVAPGVELVVPPAAGPAVELVEPAAVPELELEPVEPPAGWLPPAADDPPLLEAPGASEVTVAVGSGGGVAPTPKFPPLNCGFAQLADVNVAGAAPVMYPIALAMNWLSCVGSGE
jgi:hypothetical protein